MNKNLLMGFQTYEEFPDSYLLVKKDSNVFLAIIKDEKFVVRQNIDKVSFDIINGNPCISSEISIYNVIDDSLVFCFNNECSDKIDIDENINIQHLHKYLGLKDEEEVCLSLNDVNEIIAKEKQLKKN